VSLTRKDLFLRYVNRYKFLIRLNKFEMVDEIRRIIVEDLSDNMTLPLPSDQWIEAKDKATMSVHCCLSRVCVVKPIESDETIDTIKLHEPFRAAMQPQTHILYKWICLCTIGMEKGFCAHCFFVEHHKHNDHHIPTPIPESVDQRSLSAMSHNNRPFIRRGRPSNSVMSRSLDV